MGNLFTFYDAACKKIEGAIVFFNLHHACKLLPILIELKDISCDEDVRLDRILLFYKWQKKNKMIENVASDRENPFLLIFLI